MNNPISQTAIEQPLDLSKKEALTQSVCKDNDANSIKIVSSPPADQKSTDTSSVHNPDTDDLEDSPLVIDEETTDSVETKRTPPTLGETVPKVQCRNAGKCGNFVENFYAPFIYRVLMTSPMYSVAFSFQNQPPANVKNENENANQSEAPSAGEIEQGVYFCDRCDKTFSKHSSLARHKYEHSGT